MADAPDRRDVILDSAAALFAAKGVSSTTVREIADSVGILSGSLYHHFDSKNAMVETLILSYLEDLLQRYDRVVALGHDPATSLRELVRESLATADAHPHATEIYQKEGNYLRGLPRYGEVRAAAAKVQRTWLEVIGAGVRAKVLRDDIDQRVFYRLLRDSLWLSVRWHKPGGPYPTSKLAKDLTAIFLDGFALHPDRGEASPVVGGALSGDARPATRQLASGRASS